MRHAVPATMNERGAARRPFGGRKVRTDWAVPYPRLAEAPGIARHGIGKLKRRWLPLQASDAQQRVMRALKHEFDPYGLLAPGNVL